MKKNKLMEYNYMTNIKKYFIPVLSSIIIASLNLQAQGDKGKFRERIDSMVENIFQRFDDKLGTYIFRDEPKNDTELNDSLVEETTDIELLSDSKDYHQKSHGSTTFYAISADRGIVRNAFPTVPWEFLDDNFLFRYNRVEGLVLGLNYPQRFYWSGHNIALFGSGSYGFAVHRWRGGLGLAQQFGNGKNLFEVGIEGHSLTDTRDQWLVDIGENNLAAIFLRDDYRDYFGREGFSGWIGLYKRWLKSDLQFQTAFLDDRYESLERNTNWSVFGSHKIFRDNPEILEGRMKSILATLKYHSTESRKIFTTGWSLCASTEISGRSLGGDFDFNSYIIDVRRYQPISDYDNLNIRLRAGSATGDVPLQKAFDLGGFNTIPAFRFKEFVGNRMLLVNAEYVVNGKLFDNVEMVPSWLLRNVNIIFFADAGYIASAKSTDSFIKGFKDVSSKTIRSDWGIGIGTRDAKLRLGFAWRTDKSEPVKVFIRLNRPF